MTTMFVTTSSCENSNPVPADTVLTNPIPNPDPDSNPGYWVRSGHPDQDLVIVQLNNTVSDQYQPPAGVWPPVEQPAHPASSATHQLIHGLPPANGTVHLTNLTPPDDELVDEEVAEDGEDIEDEDEGYRTHSSVNGGSPPSSLSVSPPPVRTDTITATTPTPMGMRQIYPQHLTQEQQRLIQAARNGEDMGPGNSSLMWLLDFKLDFFNEGNNPQSYQAQQYHLQQQQQQQHQIQQQEQQQQQQQQQLIQSGQMTLTEVAQQQFLHIDTMDQIGKDVPTTFVQPVMSPSHDVVVMTSQSPVEPTQTTTLSPVQCVSPTSLSPKSVAKPNPEPIPHQPNGIKSQGPSGIKSTLKESERSSKKPPYTYTELITQALKDKTALTVSGIYLWIIDRYPYFKAEDDRWKNSVRHNLSMNPHFRKGDKSKHGAGHLWVLADYEEDPNEPGVPADHSSEEEEEEDEAARAVRTILGQETSNVTSAVETAAMDGSSLSPELSRSGESNKENQHFLRSNPDSNQGLPESLQQTIADIKRKCMKRPRPSGSVPSPVPSTRARRSQTQNGPTMDVRYVSPAKLGQSAQEPFAQAPVAAAPPKRVLVIPTPVEGVPSAPSTFSPMEQIEDLSYCYDHEDVATIEKALGIDFHEPGAQRQLLAK